MQDELFVKPTPGLRVRNPERGGELLPEDGAAVPRNSYWLRRLRDGDVMEAQPPRVAVIDEAPVARDKRKEK